MTNQEPSETKEKIPHSVFVLEDIVKSLEKVDLEKAEEIVVSSSRQVNENWSGNTQTTTHKNVCFNENGVLIAHTGERDSTDDYDYTEKGHKLYLLKNNRLALFSFNARSITYGRLSGPGYTGDEETHIEYEAELEEIFRFNSGFYKRDN